jgi:hypothetical protein
MAPPLSINELIPPDDFPADQFEALYQKLGGAHGKSDEYGEYIIGALYAIPYRFKALAEYDESFRSLIRDHGTGPGQPFRYMQERDLFGFFSNAHSVFDAFCFALFAIGSLLDSANFSLATDADERNVTWSTMLRAYGKAFPTDPILSELEKIWKDTEELRDIRNSLTHRGVGSRAFGVSTDASTTPEGTTTSRLNNMLLELDTTSARRSKVACLLRLGLDATDTFLVRRNVGLGGTAR